jgi:outer membrane receptor protein involved in Fe transport
MGTVQISAPSVRDQALRAQASIPLDTINVEGGGAQGQQAHPYGYGPGSGDRISNPQQVVAASKTGTKLADIPGSVQTVPHELLYEQGATMLRQSLDNASGVNFGGQDSKGFYDHFLIRGLNAQIYEDGFTDGDQLGGISHSLNGVDCRCCRTRLNCSAAATGRYNQYRSVHASSDHYGASCGGILRHGRQSNAITGLTTLPD